MIINKFNKNEKDLILSNLNNKGIVIINNIEDEVDLIEFSKIYGKIFFHPHSNENGITYIDNRLVDNRNVDSGFANNELLLHTDRGTYIGLPPKLLLLYCQKESFLGGENIFVDNYKVLSYLKDNHKGLYRYYRNNSEPVYNNGEEKYSHKIIEKYGNEYIFRIYLDKRVVKDSFYYKNLSIISNIFNKYMFEIKLKQGETILFNNWRFVHGRKKFYGDRIMLRILLESYSF